MRSINYKWFAIFKALRNVKVATISHSPALSLKCLYNFISVQLICRLNILISRYWLADLKLSCNFVNRSRLLFLSFVCILIRWVRLSNIFIRHLSKRVLSVCLSKVVHHVFDDACLQNIRYVDFFCKLCHECRFSHTPGAADKNDKWDSFLIESGN